MLFRLLCFLLNIEFPASQDWPSHWVPHNLDEADGTSYLQSKRDQSEQRLAFVVLGGGFGLMEIQWTSKKYIVKKNVFFVSNLCLLLSLTTIIPFFLWQKKILWCSKHNSHVACDEHTGTLGQEILCGSSNCLALDDPLNIFTCLKAQCFA